MKSLFLKLNLRVLLLVTTVFTICFGCSDPNAVTSFWPDIDQDGFGDASTAGVFYAINQAPANYVRNNSDCNDNDATVYPDAVEIPDNLIDEDCNGTISVTLFVDQDDDGFGDPNVTEIVEILVDETIPTGYSEFAGDCDDSNPAVNPIAFEIEGNNIDDNCDGLVDIFEIYTDNDNDGYGSGFPLAPPANGVHNDLDCNDNDASIHPYVRDISDGVDNDCDGLIDED